MSSASGSNPEPAVFLSYAREDAGAIRRFATALRAAGVEVWIDESELHGGDEWDRKVHEQIRCCSIFVPVISANTQAQPAGDFRREWHLAEQRSPLIAEGRPYIVPVCLDETRERDAFVPETFLAVPWTRLPRGESRPEFVDQVKRWVTGEERARIALPGSGNGTDREEPAPAAPRIPDYELVRKIGQGSYGDVWLARGATGIWRAIKIVWRERFADAEPFEREWRGLKEFAAISLGESIQLALLHLGRNDAMGFFYYVMELADDAESDRPFDPASYVPLTFTELRARRGRLPVDECVCHGVELARVLAGLHRRGLVHRDIKPSNAILVAGVAKLADIGLVAPTASARTFVGTEGFVPPEGPGSPGADVYALGRVLYELSTGLDRQEFPQLPPELNRLPDHRALLALNEVVLRACDPLPEKRYRDGAALLADLTALEAGRPVRRFARWQLIAAAAVLAVTLAGVATWKWPRAAGQLKAAATQSAPQPEATSVAVLPFANLSGAAVPEHFCDAFTEAILNALLSERDLRVPGRASSFYFKGKNMPATEIARALNVSRLVEGTVQQVGSHVRVVVHLTRATDGFSEALGTFDQEVTDIFALQDRVARVVVEKLTDRRPGQLVAVLTKNADAYDAYLRGRALRISGGISAERTHQMERIFKSVVELDPNFAAAWAELAVVSSMFVFYRYDTNPPTRKAQAEAAMAKALQLAPEAPEVRRAQPYLTYYLDRDYALAAAQVEALIRKLPNDASLYALLGNSQRRAGHWADALVSLRRATELDQASNAYSQSFALALLSLRRWEDVWVEARRTATLRGGVKATEDWIMCMKAIAYESRTEIDAYLAGLSPEEREKPRILDMRRDRARERGELAEFDRLDRQLRQIGVDEEELHKDLPDIFPFGSVFGYAQLGDYASAKAQLRLPLQDLRELLKSHPDQRAAVMKLGLAEALLGNRGDALGYGRRAVELTSKIPDNIDGPQSARMFAIVRAWCGEEDRALEDLQRLTTVPGSALAAGELTHGALWTPLRNDPRFSARFNAIIDLVRKNTPLPLAHATGARPAKPPP